jgi:hypothetical protein
MNGMRRLSRREAMLLLGGATITVTVAACGSSPSGPSLPPPGPGDKDGAIAENHGHLARITAAQLDAGGALLLDIRGSADHRHTVALTADEVVRIRTSTRVSKSSSTEESHTHTVTFN